MGPFEITITNDSTHVLRILQGMAGVYSTLCDALHPGKTYVFELYPLETYLPPMWSQRHNYSDSPCYITRCYEVLEWEEISIYTTPEDFETWIGISLRDRGIDYKERHPYKAVKSQASATMNRVISRSGKLELHLKKVKICHAQCTHLVQTFSKGIQEMTENYTKVFQDESKIRRLYNSKKLRNLVNYLDSLETCVRDTENFLLEDCCREWICFALEVSATLRSPETTTRSKFDLLIGELGWNLDKIRYALCLGRESLRVEWTWCTILCRYVLIEASHEGPHNIGGPSTDRVNRDSDRDNLRRHLENGSIFAKEHPFIFVSKSWRGFQQNGSRKAFEAILKKRLSSEICVSSTSKCSSIPVKDFRINHLDLKCDSEELSRGSFKSLYRGEWFGQEVAIAIMVHAESLEFLVEREAGFLVGLQHPNIVAFYGYSYSDDARLPAFKNSTAAGYLVMELMEGDLLQAIKNRLKSTGPFSISVALDIMLQIVEAMVYLHERDIMHRDLKPMNCLVKARSAPPDVYYTVKLTDFGSARQVDTESISDKFSVNPGTTRWMAPEMLGPPGSYEKVTYTKSADVYGFAIISYQVVTGVETPLSEIPGGAVIEAVTSGKRPSFPGSLSCPEGLKQLIIDCWHPCPMHRPRFKDIRIRLWSIRRDIDLQV